jgi:hypothetical protein
MNYSKNQAISAGLKGSIGYIVQGRGLNLTTHLGFMVANY